MDDMSTYPGELAADIPSQAPPKRAGKDSTWATRTIMVALQVIVAVAVFQLFRDVLFARTASNLTLSLLGCMLATILACLILMKYQMLIQNFSRDNVQLAERLGARTCALEKANDEMRREIAEKARIDKALLESESRFRTIVREAALGIALIDRRGRLIEGNPALAAMLGYPAEALRGMELTRINHPGDGETRRQDFQEVLTGKLNVCRFETRYIRKDGWVGWGRQCLSVVRDLGGKPQFVIALFEDITDRRESEAKIRAYQEQLQSLASELSLTEERERRRLASLVHDHIAQLLVVAKGKFEKLQESALFRTLARPMDEIRRLIEESIGASRSLVFELSPPILYDLGFEPAMEWLAEQMNEQYGLAVTVEDDGQPKPLDNEARVVLFRAVRELLFNVFKHAQASGATVCLRREGELLRVIVADDGLGFPPDKREALSGKLKQYGLFSIRERLTYFGGAMEIDSTPGRGARVILSLPLTVDQKTMASHPTSPTIFPLISLPEVARAANRPPVKTRLRNLPHPSPPPRNEIPV
jgi:PAS domain S-box-containing protein